MFRFKTIVLVMCTEWIAWFAYMEKQVHGATKWMAEQFVLTSAHSEPVDEGRIRESVFRAVADQTRPSRFKWSDV